MNPSGKLPVTFAAAEADLPHPTVPGLEPRAAGQAGAANGEGAVEKSFDVNYTEGVRFGYKWFDSEDKAPLYPFGFGLSYTEFLYSGLKVDEAETCGQLYVEERGTRLRAMRLLRFTWSCRRRREKTSSVWRDGAECHLLRARAAR